MASGALSAMIGHVRRVATAGDSAAWSDGELLESFLAQGDEFAFETLLRRHGPMVLGVCRRVLPHGPDAEDAFQATFLVLVRKAHTISRRELLANWLYGVACRTARKARSLLLRDRYRQRQVLDMADVPATDPTEASDLRAVLDQELGRLPEKYRVPLVLCELEGRSRKEAACVLRLPEGTVSSRLARGRQLLASRLTRRGLALSVTALAGALAQSRAEAGVPPILLETTTQVATGAAVISARVVTLTEGVLRTMVPLKLKFVLAVLLSCVLLGASLLVPPAAVKQAAAAAQAKPMDPKQTPRQRSVILLWMNGGPSQMDTFDLKPGQANGGPFKEIETVAKDIRISEHLPRLAKFTDQMVLIRSLSHREGDHQRGTLMMRTGYAPGTGILFPPFTSVLAKELGSDKAAMPDYVTIDPSPVIAAAYDPGFLGARYAPISVGVRGNQVDVPGVAALQESYKERAPKLQQALADAANLAAEPAALRDDYGRHDFGQSCLLARRLVERGVPVVEITLGGWDSHADNFTLVERQSRALDAGWGALLADLKKRDLLDSTLIVWAGEFGRTPRINAQFGRDHWPFAFTAVLAGGGIKGGQAIGKTDADGQIEERPVSVPEFLATVYAAVGVDHTKRYPSGQGIMVPIVDNRAEPIREVLGVKKAR
jgi:RNA polymerase sigma factor (sigma-70 family)